MTFDAYSYRFPIKRKCPKCGGIITFIAASTWYGHLEYCKGTKEHKQPIKEDQERKDQLNKSLEEFKKKHNIN